MRDLSEKTYFRHENRTESENYLKDEKENDHEPHHNASEITYQQRIDQGNNSRNAYHRED
jgi:hypothetical protein